MQSSLVVPTKVAKVSEMSTSHRTCIRFSQWHVKANLGKAAAWYLKGGTDGSTVSEQRFFNLKRLWCIFLMREKRKRILNRLWNNSSGRLWEPKELQGAKLQPATRDERSFAMSFMVSQIHPSCKLSWLSGSKERNRKGRPGFRDEKTNRHLTSEYDTKWQHETQGSERLLLNIYCNYYLFKGKVVLSLCQTWRGGGLQVCCCLHIFDLVHCLMGNQQKHLLTFRGRDKESNAES